MRNGENGSTFSRGKATTAISKPGRKGKEGTMRQPGIGIRLFHLILLPAAVFATCALAVIIARPGAGWISLEAAADGSRPSQPPASNLERDGMSRSRSLTPTVDQAAMSPRSRVLI